MEDMNVKKRVTEDTLKIDGREFLIKKFDPLLGNYIIMKCMTMVLPFGVADMISAKVPNAASAINSISNKQSMSKAEFLDLQRDILSCAFELLPGDTAPVVRDNGTYGINDFNANIAIQLLIAILAFNFSDFFGETALSSSGTGLLDSILANTKM